MILMFGDIHDDFRHVLPAVVEHRPKAIILLGDMEASHPLEKELETVLSKTEVYWIPGNHDTDTVENYRNLFQSELADRNLHGRVVEIAGLRVAGLGGVFRGEVWYPDTPESPSHYESYEEYQKNSTAGRIASARKSNHAKIESIATGKLLTHKSSIFYKEWFNLYGQQADILVTHEAPSCHPHGFQVLTELARSLHVKFYFHGHMHDALNYSDKFDELEFSCFGVGFRGITDMYGGKIRIGHHDSHYDREYQKLKGTK